MDTCARPLFLVTTSHRPSQRVRSFVKDLASILPCSVRFTRGKATLRDLFFESHNTGVKRIVVVSTWKGNPGTIRVYEPGEVLEEGFKPIVSIRLSGVRLSRERPGAQRGPRVASLGVFTTSTSEEYRLLCDTLVKAFLARLVLGEDRAGVDVVAVIRPATAGRAAEIDFVCPGTGKPCGPLLRVVRVEDHVSGFRMYWRRRG